MLFRAGDNTWAGLTDVDFRVGRFGQLEFTHEGEDYSVQYMPVGMQEIECAARVDDRADDATRASITASCRRAAATAR